MNNSSIVKASLNDAKSSWAIKPLPYAKLIDWYNSLAITYLPSAFVVLNNVDTSLPRVDSVPPSTKFVEISPNVLNWLALLLIKIWSASPNVNAIEFVTLFVVSSNAYSLAVAFTLSKVSPPKLPSTDKPIIA